MKIEVANNHIDECLDLLEEAKERIIEEWGLVAEGYAKMNCPVDTGRLRNSISHGSEGDDTMVVGTNVEYAPYVELGHTTNSGKFVSPQPYLAPAIEEHMDEYKEIMQDELQNV